MVALLASHATNSRRVRYWMLAACVVGCLCPLPTSAVAKVHVDPNGPAGQEYALPLDSARGDAAGNSSVGVAGSNAKAPLFGQGITPRGSRHGERGNSEPGSRGGKDGAVAGEGTSSTAALTDGGGSSGLWILVVLAAIVIVGGSAGLLARRRFTAPSAG
jgi:hypothetical protein